MKRTTELIAEPGDRVEVQDLNGNWFPAVCVGVELPDEGSGAPPFYWITFPTDPERKFMVHDSDFRKPEQPETA